MKSSVTDAVDFDCVCPDCTTCFRPGHETCPECSRQRPDDGWGTLASSIYAYLGQIIDRRYRLDRFLGGGGAGDVYRATDIRLDRPMALKVLEVSGADDEEMAHIKRRFENEVEALSRIRNPHVINIHEALTLEGGVPAMLTEYIEGRTLGEILDEAGEIEIKSAMVLAHQIANGLHEAHLRGVIHRDIKPDNVIVERLPASGWFARLLDFGLVHIVDSRRETQGFHGTPLYVAPEQCRGDGEITAAADIYPLGCLLFHLVAGRPPFDYGDARALIFAHVDEAPPRLSDVSGRDVPERLDDLVDSMLEKDPEHRPPDLSRVVHQLEQLIDQVKGARTSVGVETKDGLRPSTSSLRWESSFGLNRQDSLGKSVAEEVPDTRRLAQLVQFMDLDERFEEVEPPFVATAIDGQGDCAAVSDSAGGVYAMSLRGQEYCERYTEGGDRVTALAVDARVGSLYGVGSDGAIRRWDLVRPECPPEIVYEVGRYTVALAAGANGQKIYWLTEHGDLWEYDLRLERAHECTQLPNIATHVAAGGSGDHVLVAGPGGEIWLVESPASEAETRLLATLDSGIDALHFDHPEGAILVASEERAFYGGRADADDLQLLDNSVAAVRNIGVTADFQIIGLGTKGGTVQSWRLRYEKFERRLEWFERRASTAGSRPIALLGRE